MPKHTIGEKNINQIAMFVSKLGIRNIYLLRYHSLGEAKLAPIESNQPRLNLNPPTEQQIRRVVTQFERFGINSEVL